MGGERDTGRMCGVRLATLNVSAPPKHRATGLLELLWSAEDDLWVLTETSRGEGTRLITQVCRAAGHEVIASDPAAGGGLGVLVVGRGEGVSLALEDVAPPTVLPGRVLPVRVTWAGGELRVAAVYGAASDPVRYSSAAQRARKREWLAALGPWLERWAEHDPGTPRLLVGDLNLVDPLHDDELRYVLPEETALYEVLTAEHGLVDLWRAAHPGSTEASWVDHTGVGCRYDHAFGSAGLAPFVASCELDQEPRTRGLTDHALLRVALEG